MKLLDRSPRFPYYTLHGTDHHLNLLSNLAILMEGGVKLSQRELYLLLLAIAVHDIGMVLPMKDYTFKQVAEGRPGFLDPAAFENFVRDVHHEVIDRYFSNEMNFLTGIGITIPDLSLVLEIARAHRKIKLVEQKDAVRRLGAVMRLIDEMDIGPGRAPMTVFRQREDEMDSLSAWHWYKHMITDAWTVQNNVTFKTENGRASIILSVGVHPPEEKSIPYWFAQVRRAINKALEDEQCQKIIEKEFGVTVELDADQSLCSPLRLTSEWSDLEAKIVGSSLASILVVDDDIKRIEDLFLPLMERCFVRCVPKVETALEYLEAQPVDLVVVDMQMPVDEIWSAHETQDYRFTGMILGKHIQEAYPDILLVALTGTRHNLPEGADDVFDAVLRKPIDSFVLRDTIINLIEDEDDE